MSIHHSLDYYLNIRELPILDRFRQKDINYEFGCFIGIDVVYPLYRVLEMKAQSLIGTWEEVNKYLNRAFLIITEEFNESVNNEIDYKFQDIDKEVLWEITNQLKVPPQACYPIYFITVGEGPKERVVYIGKTSSKNHRFSGGHSAALKLHAPEYSTMIKKIYFGTVTFLDNEKAYMPLEFIQPYHSAKSLLNSLEAGLIFNLKPELNKIHLERNNAKFNMVVNIENHSSQPNFFHYHQVCI